MKLYMIRHGQTDNNLKGLFSGWFQAQLTDEGRAQARAAGERLRGIPIECVYASDLDRTLETARLLFPDKEIIPNSDLREIHVGSLGGCPYEDAEKEDRTYSDYTSYGGESRVELVARVKRFLKTVEALPYERVAAVTHGGLICSMIDVIADCLLPNGKSSCYNCSVSVFEHTENGWRMVRWNDTGDLL